MYCNFDTRQPDAYFMNEHLLSMFASSGRWNDVAAGHAPVMQCACRWDPVVFGVFPVSPRNVSLPYCRWCCVTWRPGAYVATILSAEENAMVYTLLWSNWTYVALGARRQPDSDSMESKRFRWTEGPLGAADGGLGTLFWTTQADFTDGTCAAGRYCNFMDGYPNNVGRNQRQLVISGPHESTASTWDDRTFTVMASTTMFAGCACRYDVAVLIESMTLTASSVSRASSSSESERSCGAVPTTSLSVSASVTPNLISFSGSLSQRSTSPSTSLSPHRLMSSFTRTFGSVSVTMSRSQPYFSQSDSLRVDERTRRTETMTLSGSPSPSFGSSSTTTVLHVGSPNELRPSAAVARAAAAVQWGSVFSGAPTSATAVSRLAVTQQLLYCRPLDGDGGGLLGMLLPGSGDALQASARGAVAGNTVVLCAAAMCLFACAALFVAVTKCSLPVAVLRVALPSSLHPVWVTVLQSTVGAAPPLVPPYSGGDAAAVCALAAVAAGPPLVLCVLLYRVKQHLQLIAVPSLCSRPAAPPSFAQKWRSLWARRFRWTAVGECGGAVSARCVWVLLLEYRALWYATVDAAVVIAVSAAASASVTAGSVPACRAVAVGILVAYAVQLVVATVTQPLLVPAAQLVTTVTLALSCVSVALQLPVLWGVQRTDELLVLLSVVQSLALGVAGVKIFFDIWNVQRAAVRFVNDLRAANADASVPCNVVDAPSWKGSQVLDLVELSAIAQIDDDAADIRGAAENRFDCGTASRETVGGECAAMELSLGADTHSFFVNGRRTFSVSLFEELEAINFESLRSGY